jgi:hypothetical protein
MEELKESKANPNAYYLGDLIGTLQYKKDYNTIKNMIIPDNPNDNPKNMILEYHTKENLNRFTTLSQRDKNWKILLIMKESRDNVIIMKGALLNQDTNEIALLTTINSEQFIRDKNNRPVKTIDANWFVGHYRLLAPLIFWRELQNRL